MDRQPERVCICIPVYNGEKYIEDTIHSLLRQDFPNYEILICDNLSSDNTKNIVERLMRNSAVKISYLLNPHKGSAEENWNFLLKNLPAYAKYIALYHADDIYSPSIISEQYQLLAETGVGAVFALSRIIDEEGKDITVDVKHKIDLPEEFGDNNVLNYEDALYLVCKYRNFIRTPSFFFRREILAHYPTFFDISFKSSADLDFWLRIAATDRIAIVRKALFSYRVSRSQGSYQIMQNRELPSDFFSVLQFHLNQKSDESLYKWYKAYLSMDLIICSINLARNGKKHQAIRALDEALDVKNVGQLIKIYSGLKHYFFGLTLKIALLLNIERYLIRISKY